MNMQIMTPLIILGFAVVFTSTATSAKNLTSDTKVYKHNKSSGGTGIDSIQLKPPRTIGNNCVVFKNAVIKYTKRHYGVVKITKTPKAECNPQKEQCKLGVSWQHSPAGRLGYKVKVIWDLKPCS